MTARLACNPSRSVRYLFVLFALSLTGGCSIIGPALKVGAIRAVATAQARRAPEFRVATPPSARSADPAAVVQDTAFVTQSGQVIARSEASGLPAEVRLQPGPFEIRLPRVDADGSVLACASTAPASLVSGRTGVLIDWLGCFEPTKRGAQDDGPIQTMGVGVGNVHMYFDSGGRADSGSSTLLQFGGVEYVDGAAGPFYLILILDHDGDGVLDRGESHHFHVNPLARDAPPTSQAVRDAAAVGGTRPAAPRRPGSTTSTAGPLASIVGVWSDAGKCREYMFVFTPEGYYFEMGADRSRTLYSEIWDVVPGMYDVTAARRPPFRLSLQGNWSMHSSEMDVTTLTESQVTGQFVGSDELYDSEELTPFRWVRCQVTAADGPPF